MSELHKDANNSGELIIGSQHVPDASRLPACVSSWRPVGGATIYTDGSQLLVALPMWNRNKKGWRYDFHVVHVRCDEDYFSLEDSNGEPFGWDIFDVDFYVELSR